MLLLLTLIACSGAPPEPETETDVGAVVPSDDTVEVEAPPAVDALGDPLPDGAIARLGTQRLRQSTEVMALSWVGDRIASARRDGAVVLWDGATGRRVGVLEGEGGWPHALDAHGTKLAVAHENSVLRVWDGEAVSWEASAVPAGGDLDIVHDVEWAPSGGWLASAHGGAWRVNGHRKLEADGGCAVCVWSADGTLNHAIAHDDWAYSVAVGDDLLASGHESGMIRLWDPNTGESRSEIRAGDARLFALAATPDGKLVGGDESGNIRLWDPVTGKARQLHTSDNGITRVEVTGDGAWVVWADSNYRWGLEPLAGGAPHRVSAREVVRDVAPGPEGVVAIGGMHKRVRRWQITGKRFREPGWIAGQAQWVRFTPDGRHVLVRSRDTVKRYQTSDWSVVGSFELAANTHGTALSPDGTTIAAAYGYGRVALFDAESGDKLRDLMTSPERGYRLDFSPDGSQLIVSGEIAQIWDVASGKILGARTCKGRALDAVILRHNWVVVACSEGGVREFSPSGTQTQELPAESGGLAKHVDDVHWAVAERERNRIVHGDRLPGAESRWHNVGSPPLIAFVDDVLVHAAPSGEVSVERKPFQAHNEAILSMDWRRGTPQLATASADGTVLIWELDVYIAPKQLVFGHRGFPGTYPDHTLAGYSAAAKGGADYIEPDLVKTRDGILIARHEPEIGGTTDVAAKFPDRKTTRTIDGEQVTGWFAQDFTLEEIKTLWATQPLEFRPHDQDDKHRVATFEEILVLADKLSQQLGRPIGVYPETKHPSYHAEQGLQLEPSMLFELKNRPGQTPVFIQSFEVDNLKAMADVGYPLIQLMNWETVPTTDELRAVAEYANGIGVHKSQVWPRNEDGTYAAQTDLIRDAHALGLLVHVYTFRSEDRYLSPDDGGDPAAEVRRFLDSGVDGVFADFPDVAYQARAARP